MRPLGPPSDGGCPHLGSGGGAGGIPDPKQMSPTPTPSVGLKKKKPHRGATIRSLPRPINYCKSNFFAAKCGFRRTVGEKNTEASHLTFILLQLLFSFTLTFAAMLTRKEARRRLETPPRFPRHREWPRSQLIIRTPPQGVTAEGTAPAPLLPLVPHGVEIAMGCPDPACAPGARLMGRRCLPDGKSLDATGQLEYSKKMRFHVVSPVLGWRFPGF